VGLRYLFKVSVQHIPSLEKQTSVTARKQSKNTKNSVLPIHSITLMKTLLFERLTGHPQITLYRRIIESRGFAIWKLVVKMHLTFHRTAQNSVEDLNSKYSTPHQANQYKKFKKEKLNFTTKKIYPPSCLYYTDPYLSYLVARLLLTL